MNATTKTCCLLGNPVGHSKSPFIHNTLAKMMGINMVYIAYKVENGRLGDAIRGADALDFLGLNITVPYKCDVIEYLAEIDPLAEKIGAVNTLVRTGNGYKGYNTDIIGLGRQLDEEKTYVFLRKGTKDTREIMCPVLEGEKDYFDVLSKESIMNAQGVLCFTMDSYSVKVISTKSKKD